VYTKSKPEDFSVAVRRKRSSENQWKWEIHRAGRIRAVAQSSESFSTMQAAHEAGKEALAELLKTSPRVRKW
jgi:hypothetical protein